jgi:hypothetical protein
MSDVIHRPGHDALWGWFGLSYASWLTLPRILMHEMPDEWQARMAALLHEYNETFPNQPPYGTTVRATTANGKITRMPDWISEYRHPFNARTQIYECRGKPK